MTEVVLVTDVCLLTCPCEGSQSGTLVLTPQTHSTNEDNLIPGHLAAKMCKLIKKESSLMFCVT